MGMPANRGYMSKIEFKSRLHQMTQTTPSVLWNDSCSIQELSSSIEINGAVGATCNPVIVLSVLKKEWNLWKDRIFQIIHEMPEILGMSDRVVVMCNGRVTGEFNREEASEEAIMTSATQFMNVKNIMN